MVEGEGAAPPHKHVGGSGVGNVENGYTTAQPQGEGEGEDDPNNRSLESVEAKEVVTHQDQAAL